MSAPTLISACAFLKRHAPGLRQATREELKAFVGWYWRDGRCGVIHNAGKIVAIALARCVPDCAAAQNDPFLHIDHGPVIWVDDIVSRHPFGVALLLEQSLQRFGPRSYFAGRVFSRDGELRMLPTRAVQRLIASIPHHHGITINSATARAA